MFCAESCDPQSLNGAYGDSEVYWLTLRGFIEIDDVDCGPVATLNHMLDLTTTYCAPHTQQETKQNRLRATLQINFTIQVDKMKVNSNQIRSDIQIHSRIHSQIHSQINS